jgi:hypothetical protein
MWRWRGLLLVLLLSGGCAASIPTDVLRDAQFAVESRKSVFRLDGSGERPILVLERRETRDGLAPLDKLHDEFFAPSLSPDGSWIACLRFRNNSGGGNIDALMPLQSVEVLLVRIDDRSEHVVASIPATERGRVYRVLAPVWAPDGGRVFFAADGRVWSYALGDPQSRPIADIPEGFSGGFGIRQYLRPSPDGAQLFGLLSRRNRFGRYDVIVSIDLASGKLTPRWTGTLSRDSVFEVNRPLSREIDDDVGQALFGSRERPVFAPLVSRDGRFYFFGRHEMGLFGREWIAGYDRVTRKEFEVRTMWRTLFWK